MNKTNNLKGRAICLFFMIAIVVSCSQKKESNEHKVDGNALGTTFHITYVGKEINGLKSKIDSITNAVNHSLSTYQTNSLITSFNTNSNTIWQDPEESKHFPSDMQHFVEMVSLSKTISNETAGAFDPSAAALFEVYNKAKKEGVLMDEGAVAECLKHQGMQKIQFDEQGFPYKIDSFLTLNFNAVAKGYLVDLVSDCLIANGVTSFMVEVGGEMRVKGKNVEGKSWHVGINVPLLEAKSTDYFKVLEIEDVSLATSGNYQNFYKVDGKLIGHTFDPRTGKPVVTKLKSATVLHDFCAVADAYATACMVLGLEEATKVIEGNKSLSAYFIYEEGEELKGVYVE